MLETFDMIDNAVTEANWILVSQQLQQLLDNSKLQAVSEDELEQAVAIKANADALRMAIAIMRVGDFQTRWDVAKIFPQIGTQAIVPLLEILDSESADFEIRWFALGILGKFNQPEIVISLVKLLEETQEEELAIAAAQTLAKIGQSAITALIELLKQEKTRLLAVKSLAQIRRSEVIEPLLSVVDDSITSVRFTAIEALSSFHHKYLIPIFIKALQDKSFSVRKEAIIALKMRVYLKEEFSIVNHLQPLIYDINSEVCQQAILALGCMKDQMAIQTLFDFLNFPNAPLFLKKEAVRALNWNGTYQGLDYLKQSLYSSEINLCAEIITVLGRQESIEMKPYAAKILIDFLNSEQEIIDESRIKQAIVTSLGELRDKSALTYLEKLASDDDSKVKLYALAAMKKIT
ncbi:HEAT repeat domain-containing protein [Plectonema cf. radiosum LEGE 06105]|uniref:HEAT repeat domain-containing protein n=1 Tax=Plectonema cf. radiosum LEGE 06105 TaxID=945769 RepID=A0A8J7F9S7_9CYAN|nr:HEAT repeat domain-containing protein [Plectonema radiosum]MBE9214279.1 HEAT repeat domain-containing protein [Plectonema cf. radiosum LEGE 06105]